MVGNTLKNLIRTGAVCGLALFAMGTSRADIIPELQTVANNGSGHYTWTYQVDLTNDEIIKRGSFFTIYDFAGFVSGSNFQPANWVFSSAMTGKTPSKVTPTDNPGVPNLTWTYTGPRTGPGPLDLGLFGADSKYGKVQIGNFAAEATKYAPGKPGNGKPVDNVGSIGVPQASIPEPGSLALLLPGLAPLGLVLRKRSRKA
ncbi:MAG TPA: PEP-CTERM sorting domain-containing protein [Chthonomonadaceae bacterium]|nr:PEP-CTERM sorting domain-containing protein [Chthonomonadaceae bacterium]